ncbi:MAG: PLP-dependent lyase/thiolase [Acidimicrobiales bacterium]
MPKPDNPFIRYRERLDSYRAVQSGRLSDDRFVEMVSDLDRAVTDVEGHSFEMTPLVDGAALAAAADLGVELWIKAEHGNVGGSHKARHLFGVAVQMLVDEELGAEPAERLAIASCGNAALGAGVVAAALDRPLDVFVPTWADEAIVARLDDLGAEVNRCPRVEGESGDPAYLRFREAVTGGVRSFSVQGTDTPTTFDGGRTLGWELADQMPGGLSPDDALYIQVGGGALATAVSMAAPEPRLYPVQTEGCAPLRRAWDLLEPDFDFDRAAASPAQYMWPWETEPTSLATGILDDVTYDWLPLLRLTRQSGGEPIVVGESLIERAYALAHANTPIPVSATGSAGLAGLLHSGRTEGRAIVLFTGIDDRT